MMHCPVILFFGLYHGGNRYEIFFERFAEEIVLEPRPPRRRHPVLDAALCRSSRALRATAPYNWFNFYPFWD